MNDEQLSKQQSDEIFSYSIRYEGLDGDRHQIDLAQLGVSLQGFARVLAVCAHFSRTGKYNKQWDALSVKIVAAPVQEHHCYEIIVRIVDIALSRELWSGFGGVLFSAVVAVVLNRRKAQEMKLLNEALQKSMAQNEAVQARLLDTIDRMVDALQPAVKQAHEPIGRSVETISVFRSGADEPTIRLDRASKERAFAETPLRIGETSAYVGLISELDMLSGTCKISLEGLPPEDRVAAIITDPIARSASNPYVEAMSKLVPIRFLAKAEFDADDTIVRLYISDLAK